MIFRGVIVVKKRSVCMVLSVLALFLLTVLGMKMETPEETPALSYALGNMVIVIDAGHGGVDPGAIGPTNVLEKDVVLGISRILEDQLSKAGALIIPTRRYDEDLAGDEFTGTIRQRKQEDMRSRVELANKENADLFISVHTNAETSRKWTGGQVFYDTGHEESEKIAVAIQEALKKELKNTDRSARSANYYLMKNNNMPTIIIEVGFISNPQEEKMLVTEAYQARIAHAICSGLVASQLNDE
ncbi:MAG: N-acetylmuramoyl-L-alanine amidase [Bacillota bacterium]|nr:N-acetylmuramoyl-L-alanine amidase [Bacillota bacterium]